MRIREWADKWIVFALMFATGTFYVPHVEGLPSHTMDYVVVPGLIAAMLTVGYVVWCVVCRFAARVLLRNAAPGSVRIFANAVFFVAFLIAVMVPVLFPGQVVVETYQRSH